jgi:hypothetical protein
MLSPPAAAKLQEACVLLMRGAIMPGDVSIDAH